MRRRRTAPAQFESTDATVEPNGWTRRTIFYGLVVVSAIANGNLSPQVLPLPEDSNVQQYIGVLCWLIIIASSYFRRTVVRVAPSWGLALALAVYAIAVVSPLWSSNPMLSLPKAAALAIVTFGVYRVTCTFPYDEIVEATFLGQLALCVASAAVAILVPDIGVLKTWQHAGQWNGVFGTKQTLGVLAALLLFFSSYLLLTPLRGWRHWFGVVVALLCLVMSGSRGGGALAAFAVGCLHLTRMSLPFARALAFAPFVMGLLGATLIAYFVRTKSQYLVLFGAELDFTERTFIWQHALSYFLDRKWLGFGLSGFWTRPDVKDLFVERHGWFLDNYHDGYIAVAMETGGIGLALLIIGALFLGFRVVARIRRDGGLDLHLALALVYTCLLYFIDFTETFFLRSTNVAASLLVGSIIIIYGRPVFAPNPGKTATSVERFTPPPRYRRARAGHAR